MHYIELAGQKYFALEKVVDISFVLKYLEKSKIVQKN